MLLAPGVAVGRRARLELADEVDGLSVPNEPSVNFKDLAVVATIVLVIEAEFVLPAKTKELEARVAVGADSRDMLLPVDMFFMNGAVFDPADRINVLETASDLSTDWRDVVLALAVKIVTEAEFEPAVDTNELKPKVELKADSSNMLLEVAVMT